MDVNPDRYPTQTANGCGFYCPPPGVSNIDSYFMLYNYTSRAIKGVDAQIPVGGPATAGQAWVGEFVNLTGAGTLMPADFLSTHSYPTDYRHQPSALTRTIFEDTIIGNVAIAAAAGLPFVLTETSAGLNNAYDSYFAASFIAHQAAAFLGVGNIPTMSFWTFTDIFEEPGMQSTPYVETFGMQTKWGVPKPSYRALQLLARLPTTGLPVSAPNAAPRRTGTGPAAAATATVGNVDVIAAVAATATAVELYALVTNYNININNTEDPSTGLPVADEAGVSIVFANIPAGAVVAPTATLTLIDATHAWAKPVWIANGSPTYPTPAQIAAEMAASALVDAPLAVAVSAGAATVTLPTLTPYAVALVRLVYTPA